MGYVKCFQRTYTGCFNKIKKLIIFRVMSNRNYPPLYIILVLDMSPNLSKILISIMEYDL